MPLESSGTEFALSGLECFKGTKSSQFLL